MGYFTVDYLYSESLKNFYTYTVLCFHDNTLMLVLLLAFEEK